jgi:hypothetical protein
MQIFEIANKTSKPFPLKISAQLQDKFLNLKLFLAKNNTSVSF